MSLINITRTGPIWQLQMARPPVNALNPALCLALADAVEQAVAEGAGGIVLAGGAKVFSAGLDVPYLLSLGDDQEALLQAWSAFFRAARALAASPIPVVAAMAGHAPAGGCVLALCCDYRIMANGPFRIGLNETQVGLVAPEGIQALLARVVGPHRAERLLVAGAMPEAEEALRIGLVDELTDIDEVNARAHAWLQALLDLPSMPMRETRAIARRDVVAALAPERIDLERFVAQWRHPDTQAALRAMLARIGK
ncbi:MAG: enoyl-CoA hydratase/isomerase family protein [Thermomonas hydrothermalis]|uniref:enoyl-CoA hydratase/isomerase family protein n=1 Tax=Thermomonas hydrothermalis TaxID=213588 RepID=UPI002352A1A1|nr:enoyl-CoA hydratase/isomerase family protein [Thermomonas hydrothermalis]MCL6618616.1 enoyl-CoA hydratase/isomerase family protein [Thermomonas hydrothermalis]